jgi:hypothetical protein
MTLEAVSACHLDQFETAALLFVPGLQFGDDLLDARDRRLE